MTKIATQIAADMATREAAFLGDYQSLFDRPLTAIERKKALAFAKEHGSAQAARALGFVAALARGAADPGSVQQAADLVRRQFAGALAMHQALLGKRFMHEDYFANTNPKKKRSNFLWDLHLAFLPGAAFRGSQLTLVCGDGDIREAAAAAGVGAFAIAPEEYVARAGVRVALT